MSFFVPGQPKPERRKRVIAHGRVFHVRAEDVCAWQTVIRMVAEAMVPKPHPAFPTGAVHLELRFHMPRPKKMRPGKWHIRRPDAGNLAKPVEDALTGIAYRDDSQIAVLHVSKVYEAPAGVEVSVHALE